MSRGVSIVSQGRKGERVKGTEVAIGERREESDKGVRGEDKMRGMRREVFPW